MSLINFLEQTDPTPPTANRHKLYFGTNGHLIAIDDTGTTFDYNAAASYTNQDAQNAVGNILLDTATIDFTYNSGVPFISADLKPTTVTAGTYGGSISVPTFTVDATGRLTSASTGSALTPSSIGAQPADATLSALALFNSNGIMVQTATDTFTARTLVASTGIAISNADGVSGNPTISSTITQYDDEQAQDAVGNILLDSSDVDFTYSDGVPSITATLTTTGVGAASYGGAISIPTFTVDSKGRLSSASTGSALTPAAINAAPTTRSISAGTGLSGGGDLSADRTISLANTTVTPGTYNYTTLTVDAQGRLTAASSGAGPTGTVTNIATGTGLNGGPITTTGTISLANTAVTPGTYNYSTITVDAQGRLTAASSGAGPTGTVTNIATGTGLTGGPVTTIGTISLANTTVTPGTYGASTTIPTFTVDQQGRLSSASGISIPELAFLTGVTSAIQTQLNGKEFTITTLPISKGGTNSSTALTGNKAIVSNGTQILESATTSTEIGYLSGVTSSIQTQFSGKEPTITTLSISKGGTNNSTALTGSKVIVSSSTQLLESATTTTELGFLSGVTSSVQTQLNSKLNLTGGTLSGAITVPAVSLSGVSGAGFIDYPTQVSAPSTPAPGFRLYADASNRFSWKGSNGFVRTFNATGITADRVYTLPDQTGTLLIDPMTTIGDTIYRNSSNVSARLPIGTSSQLLRVIAGVPAWDDENLGQDFGDGSLGNATISGSITLTQIAYYDTLTLVAGAQITTNGYPIYAKTLDLSNATAGSIIWNGNNGTGTQINAAGGAGATALTATILGGSPAGGTGGAGGAAATAGTAAAASAAVSPGNGGISGAGGAGGTGAGAAGGAARAGTTPTNNVEYGRFETQFQRGVVLVQGGASGPGGSGGGGDTVTNTGRGGGGGGGGGGVVAVYADTIITSASTAAGVIQSNGGNGGGNTTQVLGGGGAGGGGGGGAGGFVYLAYNYKIGPTISGLIQANGGNGGKGGNSTTSGNAAPGGDGGGGGRILIYNAAATTGMHIVGTAGGTGSPASGTTGGNGGNGGISSGSL